MTDLWKTLQLIFHLLLENSNEWMQLVAEIMWNDELETWIRPRISWKGLKTWEGLSSPKGEPYLDY